MVTETRKLFRTAQALANETGVSRYTIQAIRKAGRESNDPLPNYCTAAEVRAWLRRHPHFVARAVFAAGAKGVGPIAVPTEKRNSPPTLAESSSDPAASPLSSDTDLAGYRKHAEWAADRESRRIIRALCDEVQFRRANEKLGGGQ